MLLLSVIAASRNTTIGPRVGGRGWGSDATLWHNLCILILFWGRSHAYSGCGCMHLEPLGLCAGTCSIYAHLQSWFRRWRSICMCGGPRSHGVYSWIKAHTWSVCWALCMTKGDWGGCGISDCSPEAVDWVLGLGYSGFCDAFSVVMA